MPFRLRPYNAQDFDPLMELWVRTWEHTYPDIDFHARLPWWKERWINELIPTGEITVAVYDSGDPVGFIVLTPATGYIDQLVVSPLVQRSGLGAMLLAYAEKRADEVLALDVNQSNEKALKFYLAQGFTITGTTINQRSQMPVYQLRRAKTA